MFRVLMELRHVVILFDEIDQLLTDRSEASGRGGALQFMTTSMLTKFQALRQRRNSVFVLTTNRFEKLDTAIRRAGRFDCHLAVMPPDKRARQKLLSNFIKKFDAEENTTFWQRLATKTFR